MFSFIHPPRNRSEAWRCAMINQLALPGLGTVIGGRKVGYAQAVIMVAGFFIVTGYLCWFIFHQTKLLFDMNISAQQFNESRFDNWWIGAIGFGLCLAAWIWSLISSIQFIKSTPENSPPPILPPKLS